MSGFFGTYDGVVEDDKDPEQLGRMKIRVPAVYGPADASSNSVPVSDLPWARPAGLPAGGSPESGAIQWLPTVGDHVYARFLDGEPEKPIWEWAGQDRKQKDAFPYWGRQPGGYGADGTAPKSGLLTRYGHGLEFSPEAVVAVTKGGYSVSIVGAGDGTPGMIQWMTAKGYQVQLDDNKDQLSVFVPTLTGLIQTITILGLDFKLTPVNSFKVETAAATIDTITTDINATASATVTSPRIALGATGASDPVVRLSDLLSAVNAITRAHNIHTHKGVPPPTVPMVVVPTGSKVTFSL